MEMSSDAFWAIALAIGTGATIWMIRMERLMTTMVEHGKASHERHDKAESRLDTHELEILALKTKLGTNE